MKPNVNLLAAGAAIALLSFQPRAHADDPTETNPQPYRCEDSVITKVGTYFENDPRSGFYAIFQSKLGVESFPDESAAVVDRGASPSSALAKQKVGDRVQVCLVFRPADGDTCHPDRDPRGRFYRVYNYRLRAAYTGTNANHLCGGA